MGGFLKTKTRTGTVELVEPGMVKTHHTFGDGDVCVTIASALEALTELDAMDVIDDFAEYADPDALDRLFRPVPGSRPRDSTGHVVLHIEGFTVTIRSDGDVLIEAPVE